MNNIKEKGTGLYIHIPFCKKRCRYCSFTSFINNDDIRKKYIERLKGEMSLYSKNDKICVDTIFFGGGTPSILEVGEIHSILEEIHCNFSVCPDAEISIEANPESLTVEKAKFYREIGINRLSLGVQSFSDDLLKYLGRIHDKKTAINAYEYACKAGLNNINIDLMLGFLHQDLDKMKESLDIAFSLDPAHISFYSLEKDDPHEIMELPQEREREIYHFTRDLLAENGYTVYEISNAAKAGKECRHNMKYWTMGDYLGLGVSAHSFFEGRRTVNTGDMDKYLYSDSWQEENILNSEEDNLSDYFFTRLRLTDGIDRKDFYQRFGFKVEDKYGEVIEDQMQKGLICYSDDKENIMATRKGIDILNKVIIAFM